MVPSITPGTELLLGRQFEGYCARVSLIHDLKHNGNAFFAIFAIFANFACVKKQKVLVNQSFVNQIFLKGFQQKVSPTGHNAL